MTCRGKNTKTQETADRIREEILRGDIRPGEKLAGIRELGERFGVTRQVLSSAFALLTKEGFLRTKPRSGVFVQDQLPQETKLKKISVGFFTYNIPFSKSSVLKLYLSLLQQAPSRSCEIFLNAHEMDQDVLQWAHNYRLDALIVYGRLNDRIITKLRRLDIPLLAVGNHKLRTPCNTLEIDIAGNLTQGMTFLQEKHHFRRFFAISSLPENAFAVRETDRVLKETARSLGMQSGDSHFSYSPGEDGYAAMKKLLSRFRFAPSDLLYLTPDSFAGAARCIFEYHLPRGKRPFLFCDGAKSEMIPYSDMIDFFLYKNNILNSDVLDRMLDCYFHRLPDNWHGVAQTEINCRSLSLQA